MKISCVFGSEELILFKCPYYHKPSMDSMQSLSKTPKAVLTVREKAIIKYIWNNNKKLFIAKAILRKRKLEPSYFLILNLYNKAIVIKTVWCWHTYIVDP